MKLSQHICDLCKKPLEGFSKGEEIKRDYIMFKGQFGVEIWNHEFNIREWFWITRDHTHELAFCDTHCLQQFIDKKRIEHDAWMKKKIALGEDPYNQDTR